MLHFWGRNVLCVVDFDGFIPSSDVYQSKLEFRIYFFSSKHDGWAGLSHSTKNGHFVDFGGTYNSIVLSTHLSEK